MHPTRNECMGWFAHVPSSNATSCLRYVHMTSSLCNTQWHRQVSGNSKYIPPIYACPYFSNLFIPLLIIYNTFSSNQLSKANSLRIGSPLVPKLIKMLRMDPKTFALDSCYGIEKFDNHSRVLSNSTQTVTSWKIIDTCRTHIGQDMWWIMWRLSVGTQCVELVSTFWYTCGFHCNLGLHV